jgi:IS5 family transposase
VPASEKLVSLFEPHADIICKGSEVAYRHKLDLSTGASGLIFDVVIEAGNPADSERLLPMLERHIARYDRPPRKVAADGSYASRDDLSQAKARGVRDMAFHKKSGLKIEDMVRSRWVYRTLRNFRASIKGRHLVPQARRWLGSCTWRGLGHFRAYSVLGRRLQPRALRPSPTRLTHCKNPGRPAPAGPMALLEPPARAPCLRHAPLASTTRRMKTLPSNGEAPKNVHQTAAYGQALASRAIGASYDRSRPRVRFIMTCAASSAGAPRFARRRYDQAGRRGDRARAAPEAGWAGDEATARLPPWSPAHVLPRRDLTNSRDGGDL